MNSVFHTVRGISSLAEDVCGYGYELFLDITQRQFVILFFSLLFFLILEDGTDTLSRNVGKGLPFDAALYPRRGRIAAETPSQALSSQKGLVCSMQLVS
jgi:hypothetical protein